MVKEGKICKIGFGCLIHHTPFECTGKTLQNVPNAAQKQQFLPMCQNYVYIFSYVNFYMYRKVKRLSMQSMMAFHKVNTHVTNIQKKKKTILSEVTFYQLSFGILIFYILCFLKNIFCYIFHLLSFSLLFFLFFEINTKNHCVEKIK